MAHAADTVLVKLAPGSGARAADAVGDALGAGAPTALPGGWSAYPVPDGVSVSEARADLASSPAAAVEVPTVLRPSAVSNDPLLTGGYQWGLVNTGKDGSTAGLDTGATRAWDVATTRARVVVAVIDTGVQITHPDLANRIWTNPGEVPGNGIDDDHNGYVDDVNGWNFRDKNNVLYSDPVADRHGTHVAGVIAAQADNGVGVAGMAPNAVVMPLKFIGPGTDGGLNTDAADAIKYAVNNGATVINASFGGDQPDAVLCDAVAWAASKGVSVVAAAGNDGVDIGVTGHYPAACAEPTLLTVTALDSAGRFPSFADYSQSLVDVAAPGVAIASTIPGDRYGNMTGTSMATPAVAGIAAIVRGENPAATPATVRAAIMSSALPQASLAGRTVTGGMASAARVMNAPDPVPADTTPPGAFTLVSPATGTVTRTPTLQVRWNPSADAATCEVLVDGVPVATTTATSAGVFASEGSRTVTVRAKDAAGNATLSNSVGVRVDVTAPKPPRIVGMRVEGTSLRLTWDSATDPDGSGVASHQVLVDDVPAPGTLAAGKPGVITVKPGVHRIAVRATDVAGNVSTSTTVATPSVAVRTVRSGSGAKAKVVSSSRATVSVGAVRKGKPTAKTSLKVRKGTTTVALPRSVARSLAQGASLKVLSAQVGG